LCAFENILKALLSKTIYSRGKILSMKFKQIVILVLCAVGMFFFSGCFYLRMREVKNQLANFDKYYIVEDSKQLSISAKTPVLYPEDIVRIMRSEPTAKEQTKSRLHYDYILEKQYQAGKDEQGNYNIKMRFSFAGGKLNKVVIDKSFFAIIPKNVFIALLKSFGSAKIDVINRRASISPKIDELYLPDKNEVVALLGRPYRQKDDIYVYNYLRENPNTKNNKLLPAEFFYNKAGNCIKCHSKVLGEITCSAMPKQLPADANTPAIANPRSDEQAVRMKTVISR
jgi:hypothetical protein